METEQRVKETGWYNQARRGNLAQRQPSVAQTAHRLDQLLRDVVDADAQALWEALIEDLPSSQQRGEWYEKPNGWLGNQTPRDIIGVGNYRSALCALRPHLINADCKMS